jgi:hypothetical protein
MHALKLLATAALTIASIPSPSRAADPAPGGLSIIGVAKGAPPTIRYYQVNSLADLDRDGRPDMGVLRVVCAGGEVSEAAYRYHEWQWNNAAGAKRQHAPVTFVKEWGAASPAMKASGPVYDVKKAKGDNARHDGGIEHTDDWTGLTLTGGSGLCADGAALARGSLNSSRSNRTAGTAFTIEGVSLDPPATIHYLRVAGGDLDGDGLAEEGVVRLVCQAGRAVDAAYAPGEPLASPRDAASGLATGKRMHKPITVVKEWDAATPSLAAGKVGYDVKKMEGARTGFGTGSEKWLRARLEPAPGVCAELAATNLNSSKSN